MHDLLSPITTEDSISWLNERLPPVSIRPAEDVHHSECHGYGADTVIARGIGLETPPQSYAHWYHGWPVTKMWLSPLFPRVPETVAYWHKYNPKSTGWPILVGEASAFDFLRDIGVDMVSLVGLPFIYSADPKVERLEGSLLVCPTHQKVTNQAERLQMEKSYVTDILQQKKHFSQIVACVNGDDVDEGRWIESFQDAGIPIVRGATGRDYNSMQRMRVLFSSFEFMTTHEISSHVAYAGYCGVKVSFFSPTPLRLPNLEDWLIWFPDVVEAEKWNTYAKENAGNAKKFPFLCTEPRKAQECAEWASDQLGLQHKRDPFEIARLLGWTYDPMNSEMKARGGFDYWFPRLGHTSAPVFYRDQLENLRGQQAESESSYAANEHLVRSLGDKLGGLESRLVEALSEVKSARLETGKCKKKVSGLEKKNRKMAEVIHSAEEWQCSWFKRAFHRWKPRS